MKPGFAVPWLCQRMVWGGVLLLLQPVPQHGILLRGCLLSLLPSSMRLVPVLPAMGKGTRDFGIGVVMPIVVIGLNFIYGMVTTFRFAKGTTRHATT